VPIAFFLISFWNNKNSRLYLQSYLLPKNMEFMGRKLLFIMVFFFSGISLFAQQIKNLGTPNIRNYTPEDYHAAEQNWSVYQDKRGIMFFGNSQGLLEFDGKTWRLIQLPNKSVIRSICEGENGKIYVGGANEFGFIEADSSGLLKFHSILDKIPENERITGDVWNIYYIDKKLIFQTFTKIIIFENDFVKIITPTNKFHRSYLVNGKLYIREWSKGLQVLENDKLVMVPDGDKFAEERIYALLPFDGNKLLIGTREKGFFIYDGQHFTPWKTENDDFFIKNQIYYGTPLGNEYFAIGTNLNGFVIIDKTGKAIQHINKEKGLQSNTIYSILPDYQKNLWVTLSTGVSYIEINSPFTTFGATYGLEAKCFTSLIFNNKLYIGGDPYIYYRDWSTYENPIHAKPFQKIEKTASQVWQLKEVDGQLFCPHSPEILILKGNDVSQISINNQAVYSLLSVKNNPNLMLAGQNDGIFVIQKEKGSWKFRNKIKGFKEFARWILPDNKENYWVAVYGSRIYKLRLDEKFDTITNIKSYELEVGYPLSIGSRISIIENKVIVSASDGFYCYNDTNDTFEPFKPFNDLIVKGHPVNIIDQDMKGNVWFTDFDGNGIFLKQTDKSYKILKVPFFKIDKNAEIYPVYTINDSNVIICRPTGFIHYDPTFKKDFNQPFNTLIREVAFLENDSIIYGGAGLTTDNKNASLKKIEYKNNSIRFSFSAPFYESIEKTIFQYKLEGFDKNWSIWEKESKKEYTNLPSGKYTFRVKAQNVYRVEGTEARFEFRILPPWYRTVWAYFGYIILSGLFVYLVVYINTRRLKAANIRLENIIRERTTEIRVKNVELESQKEEILAQRDELEDKNHKISRQNEHIKSSIRYAQTIQQAILPTQKILNEFFETFILYKPKDIVSGDFYWTSIINSETEFARKVYIAVVDCTGHGVPGAFMSMIGSRLLNEIVNEKLIHSPALILENLNEGIRKALKQQEGENTDGMDICLCSIEKKDNNKHRIIFAGAKLPLYVYRDETKKIEVVKGCRSTVGGRVLAHHDPYKNNEIFLENADTIYLSSDGFIDQNNFFRKRFSSLQFIEVLQNSANLSLTEQKTKLEEALMNWQQNQEQRDDITIIGIKLQKAPTE
jgi:serine phosphatase RsbU (regulator of sigma subunit)